LASISNDIAIAAPVEAAYRYVSDPRNAPNYISAIRRISAGPQGNPAEGQVWRAEADLMSSRSEIDLKIAQMVPNRLVRFAVTGDRDIDIIVEVRPHGSTGCEVDLTVDAHGVPAMLLNLVLGSMLQSDLKRLKGVLESEA
jgi:uncharacterized membrane protein